MALALAGATLLAPRAWAAGGTIFDNGGNVYQRVGQVQGVPGQPNLGEADGARRSLARAFDLLGAGGPRSEGAAFATARLDVHIDLARTLVQAGDHDRALGLLRRAAAEEAPPAADSTPESARVRVSLYRALASELQRRGELAEAEAAARASAWRRRTRATSKPPGMSPPCWACGARSSTSPPCASGRATCAVKRYGPPRRPKIRVTPRPSSTSRSGACSSPGQRELLGDLRGALRLYASPQAEFTAPVLAGGGRETRDNRAYVLAATARVRLALGQAARAALAFLWLEPGRQESAEMLDLRVRIHTSLARAERLLARGHRDPAACGALEPGLAPADALRTLVPRARYLAGTLADFDTLRRACLR